MFFKLAKNLVFFFKLNDTNVTMCKASLEPAEDYHHNLQLPSALWSFTASFNSYSATAVLAPVYTYQTLLGTNTF